MRTSVALQRATSILLDIYLNPNSWTEPDHRKIRSALKAEGLDSLWSVFSVRQRAMPGERKCATYSYCDEPWFLGLLRKVSMLPALNKRRMAANLAALRAFLGVVCRRENALMPALWKRIEEYREFARAFQRAASSATFRPLFAPSGPFSELKASMRHASDALEFCNEVLSRVLGQYKEGGEQLAALSELEEKVNAGREVGMIYLDFHSFQPSERDFRIWDTRRERLRLRKFDELSASTASLNRTWRSEIQLHAFRVPVARRRGTETLVRDRTLNLRDECVRLGALLAEVLLGSELHRLLGSRRGGDIK